MSEIIIKPKGFWFITCMYPCKVPSLTDGMHNLSHNILAPSASINKSLERRSLVLSSCFAWYKAFLFVGFGKTKKRFK
jgi:hypothetical protein